MKDLTQKTGFVALVGRPNVGKSTLLNTLLGEKIAAVSRKPQTTRTSITGILTKGSRQYVFLDTPGVHKPRTKLGDMMMKSVGTATTDVCAVLLITEPLAEIHPIERELLDKFGKKGVPVILLINKTDIYSPADIIRTIDVFSKEYSFASVIPLSGKTGDGVEIIFDELEEFLEEAPWFFSSDMITDQPERSIAAEIIREKLLKLLDKEIPHGIAVVIEDFKESDKLIDIRAEIFCEKASHKKIIIGKDGAMLKKVGSFAREDLEHFFNTHVNINLWVKVKENWRDNDMLLNSLGFRREDQ
ncbi:MAG: GTPase Era [Clostridia bacterium]|nr:GTPase Era [Clostridia bacterium]